MPPVPAYRRAGDRRRASAPSSASIVGLPALRLRTFYFAMTTLGFATIVTQIALAWQSVTGGGIGIAGPGLARRRSTPPWGFYYFCLGLAALCTWMTANIARSRFGRALIAIRDAEVAAEATGISKPRLLVDGVPVQRRAGGDRRRAVRVAAVLHHAGRLHLRPVGAVLHRHPDRRARLDPRPAARHHHPDRAAGVRGAAGRVVDLPLCGAAAGHRAGRCPAASPTLLDFKNRRPLEQQPRDRAAPGAAGAHARRRRTAPARSTLERHRAELRRRARHRRPRPRHPRRARCTA